MKPIPAFATPIDYLNEAEGLLHDYQHGVRDAFVQVRSYFAHPGKRSDLEMPEEKFEMPDAQKIIARNYGFEIWAKFISFIEELNKENSATWQFETAADAIVSGDLKTLENLLQKNPALVHMHSQRTHGATLLLYTGANGVEGYRQRSPQNTVAIAELLLKSGAEVDAVIVQGRGTTLGEVATSEHAAKAGTQIPLIELLVQNGASVDGDPEGWQPLIAALDNARPAAARWLADHGARLTIGSAAGIGRLDLVQQFFDSNGQYHDNQTYGKRWHVPATPEGQLVRALIYACMYGHTDIAAFLIEKGVDIAAQDEDRYTGLHYAAHSGHIETVDWLLQHNAPLEKRNCYDGTVLGQVIWSAANHAGGWGGNKPGYDYFPMVKKLVDAGAWVNRYWHTGIERIDNFIRRQTKTPLPQCQKIMAEMPCNDVPAAVAWYRDVLGFTVNYQQHDIGVIDRDKARIIIVARTEKHTGIGSCYIYVHDADALYTEYTARGVKIDKPPVSQPWGLREFLVYDPDGNRISFGQPFE
jgi:ankyrin repeat protein/catechol 2,3-dioxygenase-like lactoylglutathione lyase family enzyme